MSRKSLSSRVVFIAVSVSLLAGCAQADEGAFSSVAVATTSVGDTSGPDSAAGSTTQPEGSTTGGAGDPTSTPSAAPLQGLRYAPVADADFPVAITALPGDMSPLVALKGGQVARLVEGELVGILDISERVADQGERGLLGMAIHPDDPTRLFLHYSDREGNTTVSEFVLDDEVDPGSERVLFTARQPAGNHNGGWIQFGPDGGLYLGLGDGGGADDQFGTGQQDGPLAGIVRIDVDAATAEKYAKGLRNPWRFWIDGDTVYIADVGQNSYEEVSIAPLVSGLNFGWSIMEGTHCFSPRQDCDRTGLEIPQVEVEHGDAGTCSITGGVVYRGSAIPELSGHYFYSDFCGGYLRSFYFDGSEVGEQRDWTEQVGVPGQVVSFGVDGTGEMYVLTTEQILRVEAVR